MQSTDKTKGGPGRDLIGLAVFVLICLAISAAGGVITATSVSNWYVTLNKPSFNPPDWVFGPVWTVLYICIAVAGWRVWRNLGGALRQPAMAAYAIQLALNLSWSFFFFGLQMIGLALIDIGALLLVVVVNGFMFWRIDRLAGALFAPYALWVAFAMVLNASIWRLN